MPIIVIKFNGVITLKITYDNEKSYRVHIFQNGFLGGVQFKFGYSLTNFSQFLTYTDLDCIRLFNGWGCIQGWGSNNEDMVMKLRNVLTQIHICLKNKTENSFCCQHAVNMLATCWKRAGNMRLLLCNKRDCPLIKQPLLGNLQSIIHQN